MARLSDDLINRLKHDISLLRLVESQGHTITKIGKDHAIQCPFHDDDTPSLIISPKSNLFNCFGCGASGSTIDWVMKTQNLSFREAAVWLSNECLPFSTENEKENNPSSATAPCVALPPASMQSSLAAKSLAAECTEQEDQALLHRVIHFYHDTLKQTPEALEYLQQRVVYHFLIILFPKLFIITFPKK